MEKFIELAEALISHKHGNRIYPDDFAIEK